MTDSASKPDAGTASAVLDSEFLAMRAGLLDLAAAFDRVDRAGPAKDDPRWAKLREAAEILLADSPGRAERVQLHFSLPFDEEWREKFDLVDEPTSAN